ncbi:hypothetical protein [Cohnella nanjingensis]|uniref:Uncharacterized protein n=1 Tax=Cohnella nanjingensis TaxID=1387779 RepID=A0A7X0RS55_9BACL|nr:hypothetical protein [Cohnella nanjingensis]MBB6672677.1 hypothetical protein [Cohnella nanjingensis]
MNIDIERETKQVGRGGNRAEEHSDRLGGLAVSAELVIELLVLVVMLIQLAVASKK